MCDIKHFQRKLNQLLRMLSQKKVIANLRLEMASSVLRKCLITISSVGGGGVEGREKTENFHGMAHSSYQHDDVSGSWAKIQAICSLKPAAAHHGDHDCSSCGPGKHLSPS